MYGFGVMAHQSTTLIGGYISLHNWQVKIMDTTFVEDIIEIVNLGNGVMVVHP